MSIVVATGGRPSLIETLASTIGQLEHGDEILVERLDCPWGHEARNHAIPRCAGSHLLFIDDDDTYQPDALNVVRADLRHAPTRAHLYAMQYHDGRELHPVWPLQIGYVSTQMICVPNTPGLIGTWGDRYEGDYDFIHSTMVLRGDTPVLHPDVVALIG